MVATCKLVTKKVKHHKRSETLCAPKLSVAPVTFAKRSNALKATLLLHGHVMASGIWHTGGGHPVFVSSGSKLLKKGTYILKSSLTTGKRTKTTRQAITLS